MLRRALPSASRLGRAAAQLGPLAPEIDKLLVSLRASGGIESTMRLLYTLAALTSAYDDTSHLINFLANVAPELPRVGVRRARRGGVQPQVVGAR